ncbi:YbhB/YbcL family Raf kinase inhibitor-like protein [uncultured Actinomyces sp.]|uniref:YbhB/YbcL family Raf kinase inhibitor-like protein n=1 Tax=uncultured Actinomyces sp. TaxID=249061 RepID=UPI0025F77421|nr:YbhB/YbcL family Raf kinase inhibitor-like protein [uncultured Actinomyces sp.]
MTADLTRPRPPAPTGFLPTVPTFTLTSADLTEQGRIPDVFTGVHDNVSPALNWSGFPEQTQSFVVSCFDPDAPTMSGWWHWTIVDLDASVTSLERGAGASDLQLDGAAFHLAGDSGDHAWFGPYPPAGDGDHRYVFTVSALDVNTLGLSDEASPTMAAFTMAPHCIARATLTAIYSVPGETGAAAFLRDGK